MPTMNNRSPNDLREKVAYREGLLMAQNVLEEYIRYHRHQRDEVHTEAEHMRERGHHSAWLRGYERAQQVHMEKALAETY